MDKYINSQADLFEMLDSFTGQISWDSFYSERTKPAPFLTQSELPDENLAALIEKNPSIKTVLELGCGEGRNAIYLARQGINVTALDSSEVSIKNARANAKKHQLDVTYINDNVFSHNYEDKKYDLVYDSGLFHHLAPHRRLQYLEMLGALILKEGYFGLTCFAWGENCADQVDDWHFYESKHSGVAFKKEQLETFFGKYFHVLELRKYRDGIPNTIQGLGFLWVCLFQKK